MWLKCQPIKFKMSSMSKMTGKCDQRVISTFNQLDFLFKGIVISYLCHQVDTIHLLSHDWHMLWPCLSFMSVALMNDRHGLLHLALA